MDSPYKPIEFSTQSTEIDRFLTFVLLSGLCSFASLSNACSDFDTKRTDEVAVADLSSHLVRKKLLTEWQCWKLLAGKWKGFFLDGYRLLDQIGKDAVSSSYLVETVSTGRRMAMVVTPPGLDPNYDGRIHYEIRELPTS